MSEQNQENTTLDNITGLPSFKIKLEMEGGLMSERPIVSGTDAIEVLAEYIKDDADEAAYLIFCTGAFKPIGFIQIGIGNTYLSQVSLTRAVQATVLTHAKYAYVLHNHPELEYNNGRVRMRPSITDQHMTTMLSALLMVLGVELMDSVITCPGKSTRIYSMRAHKQYVIPTQSKQVVANVCGDAFMSLMGTNRDKMLWPKGDDTLYKDVPGWVEEHSY